MSDLAVALEEYLAVRRAVGYKLAATGCALRGFVAEMDRLGMAKVTTAATLAWAARPAAQPAWHAQRLGMARCFARFLHAIDPAHEVPPAGLLPARARRGMRHCFTEPEVEALMTAAGALRPELRGATYQTLIGLLAVTGLRVGEAAALDRADADLAGGVLRIRHAKFGKHREIPVHPATVAALRAYAARRDQLSPVPATPSFLVSAAGTRLQYSTVHATFAGLLGPAGLEDRPGLRPRMHDLRHSFAVTTLTQWHRDGADVEQRLPRLSAYLGHSEPENTYWYLHAAPELMQAAARKLETALGELP
jgi:integrase/recombinase XerD